MHRKALAISVYSRKASADGMAGTVKGRLGTDHLFHPRRPPDAYTVNVTFGRTGIEVAAESGLTIHVQVWDFQILAEAPGFDHEPRDVIVANGRRYEVMTPVGL